MIQTDRTSIKRSKKGYPKLVVVLALLLTPTTSVPADPWNNYWFGNGILGKAEIFNTTVCFTIPLFSFTFPSFSEVETTCTVNDEEESCLPSESSQTELFKQNVLGQAIFFAVTAISVAASLAFPTFLRNQDDESISEANSTSDHTAFASDNNDQYQTNGITSNTIP